MWGGQGGGIMGIANDNCCISGGKTNGTIATNTTTTTTSHCHHHRHCRRFIFFCRDFYKVEPMTVPAPFWISIVIFFSGWTGEQQLEKEFLCWAKLV
jgi:hypothetical protein